MTVHIEAAPGAMPPVAQTFATVRWPSVFLPLFAPFGISSGYVSVTLAFLLGRAGLPTASIAALIALSLWPQTWKMLWAPIVDTTGNPKLWYGVGTGLVGFCILAMSMLPATRASMPVYGALIVVSSLASTLVSMSTEVFMANCVPETMRGRASGWSQAGNLGGAGIGGGLGLLLAEHAAHPIVSGAFLAAVCTGCWAGVLILPPVRHVRDGIGYLERLKGVLLDVWAVAKSRVGYLALVLMLLPLGSGAVPWAAIAGEWRAGGDLVAVVNGLGGGLSAAVGAIIGGFICDRMEIRRAYCLFAVGAGAVAAAMAFLPRTPGVFGAGVMLYQLGVGGCYAGYGAIVLQAIGNRSAATNFNLMAALSNIPIALMTTFDGSLHDSHGTDVMLWGELAIPLIAIAAFAVLVWVTGRFDRRTASAAS